MRLANAGRTQQAAEKIEKAEQEVEKASQETEGADQQFERSSSSSSRPSRQPSIPSPRRNSSGTVPRTASHLLQAYALLDSVRNKCADDLAVAAQVKIAAEHVMAAIHAVGDTEDLLYTRQQARPA